MCQILSQTNQILKQFISKSRKRTQVLYLFAQIESIFIRARVKQGEDHAVAVSKMGRFLVAQKEQYLNVCMSAKYLFGQDF